MISFLRRLASISDELNEANRTMAAPVKIVATRFKPVSRPSINNELHQRLMAETGFRGPARRWVA
jgi:hypothetical protein